MNRVMRGSTSLRTPRLLRFALCLCAFASSASCASSSPDRPLSSLRYQLNGKLVYLPARINGSRDFWFVVDTGARHTVIDAAVAKELNLPIVSNDKMTGAGKGAVDMLHAQGLNVSVGTASLRVQDPWIIDLNASHSTEKRLDGLIGADFFAQYVIRIDPQTRTIAFFRRENFSYHGTGNRIPLKLVDNRMFVDMRLSMKDGQRVVHQVRVDTGSGDAVSDDFVRQSPDRVRSIQGVGLGKSYVDYSGVIDRIDIGPFTIRHSWGASNSAPAVGMEILRRFVMTFDVTRGSLYLEPNSHLGEPVPAPRDRQN